MSLKDKLEIGLKPDAPYRRDNLPEFQQDDPACKIAATPGESEEVKQARAECTEGPKKKMQKPEQPVPARKKGSISRSR